LTIAFASRRSEPEQDSSQGSECGRTALNDDPEKYRGRPETSCTDKNYVIVKGLIREDKRAKVHEIAEGTGIAKSNVYGISDLNLYKVSAL
jgi:hypothetical protein